MRAFTPDHDVVSKYVKCTSFGLRHTDGPSFVKHFAVTKRKICSMLCVFWFLVSLSTELPCSNIKM
jgi:hypothetical protein